MVVLTIIEELMNKRQEEFLDHFARLGVFSKVQALMGLNGENDSDVIKSQDEPSSSKSCKGVYFFSLGKNPVASKKKIFKK